MNKEDLKTGMIVETRDGKRYIVLRDVVDIGCGYKNIIIRNNAFNSFYSFSDNLLDNEFREFDIIKVYKPITGNAIYTMKDNEYLELIWERKEEKEPPQLTERERAYLKAYSYDYNWVARDKNNGVYVYVNKPVKKLKSDAWRDDSFQQNIYKNFGMDMLDFIKWEDEEPYKISDLLGDKE